jgi:hypothetical protein
VENNSTPIFLASNPLYLILLMEVASFMALVDTELYAQFKSAAEIAGATVFKADNSEQAKQIILKVLEDNGVKEVVSVVSPLETKLALKNTITEAGYQLSYSNLKESKFIYFQMKRRGYLRDYFAVNL